ncbi:lytic transglycosylase domain-containing protein [Sphingobium sp. CFD-1]|uniref:lytic transglycosylase domain-containing protein n=1 Tax=Sphingobium sp. CFD-1 TaxID=2878545 RepID=UPI00214BD7B5|nr:lytic transglycosylase domain-containing protein [Sphingobium sp. CFD-1]
MAAIRRLALMLGLGLIPWATPLHADPVAGWAGEIAKASTRFGIDRLWVEAVMRAESGGRTLWQGRPITSSAGAMGLMQLMPGTWADMRRLHGLGRNPHDPHDNIIAGAAYLAAMNQRFGYPGLFGAYHAGPARYQQFLSSGRPLPPETRAYMAIVTASLGVMGAVPPIRPQIEISPSLFFYRMERPMPQNSGAGSEAVQNPDPLFAVRRAF